MFLWKKKVYVVLSFYEISYKIFLRILHANMLV